MRTHSAVIVATVALLVPHPAVAQTATRADAPAHDDTVVVPLVLPEPWGDYPVGVHALVVVDSTRVVSDTAGRETPRPILVRIWYPAKRTVRPTRPYMQAPVAEAWRSTLPVPSGWERAVLTHGVDDAPLSTASTRWPVLLFSHGRSFPVENYQILLERLASSGWVVAAISHPGEEALTRLPDGREFPFDGPTWEDDSARGNVLMAVVDQLVLDAGRVLDRLAALDGGHLPGTAGDEVDFAGRLDLAGGVGYFGHSLGGAAAAWALPRDPRVVAAASWEGQVYREADRPLTVAGPLLYFVGGANRAELAGRQYRGGGRAAPVYEVVIHGAWHASVGDLLYVYRPYAPREWKERHRRETSAARVNQITGDYLDAFFTRYVRGTDNGMYGDLLTPDTVDAAWQTRNYPEVELRVSSEGGFWTSPAGPP